MFWEGFIQASCLPNNCGCEMIHFGEWIRQPANFFSSLFFLIIGLKLFFLSRSFYQKSWSVLCLLLGFASHLAHASFIQMAMSLDFTLILTLLSYPILVLLTKDKSKFSHLMSVLICGVAFFVFMFILNKWAKIVMCLLVFLILLTYHLNYMKGELLHSYFKRALYLLLIGFLCFMVDESKLLCAPDSWWQWHSLWHFFAAYSLYYYGRWSFSRSSYF